ncbi:hypothetical protein VD0004_g1592 [Verticillium dahliae]|nr:hypothetical protein VD0004_g1592 [Verticillium dahliae]PNH73560.1 hypothetical protein VD0001_g3981 [Verticillium dahliae]
MFHHRPLSEARREIRLLRFVAAPSSGSSPDEAPIALELCHVPLDESPDYGALSYVWGDMRETLEATVDGRPYAIGRNLHGLFLQLRRQNVTSWLWTDAICINQTDAHEKRWQIGLMRTVYVQAAVVHLWLGPGNANTDAALDALAHLGQAAEACGAPALLLQVGRAGEVADIIKNRLEIPDSPSNLGSTNEEHAVASFYQTLLADPDMYADEATGEPTPTQRGIQDMLERDYWTRMWIIQEVTVPRHAVIACGNATLSLPLFNAALGVIWACKRTFRPALPRYRAFAAAIDEQMLDVRALNTRSDYHAGVSLMLLDILYIRDPAPGRPYYAVTDPRDVVFAILGIVSDGEALGLQVDYTKTRAQVFAMLTRALIMHGDSAYGSFGLDSVVPRAAASDELPSWVVDWQAMGMRGTPQKAVRHQGLFGGWCDATRGGPGQEGTEQPGDADSGLLRQGGCRVDVVAEVLSPPAGRPCNKCTPPELCELCHPDLDWSAAEAFARLDEASKPNPDWGATVSALATAVTAMDPVSVEHMARIEEPKVFRLVSRMLLAHPIAADALDDTEAALFRDDIYGYWRSAPAEAAPTDENIAEFADALRRHWAACLRGRTFFWTEGGRLGICWAGVQACDVLSLVWNAPAPVVLGQRHGGGFVFKGDSYVAGIMEGEFLEEEPPHEVFDIY